MQPSWVLNISSDGDCEPLWVIFYFFDHHQIKKRVFLMFKQNFLYFRLCSLFLVLSQGTTEKSGSVIFTLSHQIFVHFDKLPP